MSIIRNDFGDMGCSKKKTHPHTTRYIDGIEYEVCSYDKSFRRETGGPKLASAAPVSNSNEDE